MIGLILKDLFTLTRQALMYIVFIAVFSLMPGYNMASFAVMMACMMPMTALAYDERSHWDRLAASMPYTTAQLVLSKYLMGLILMLGSVALGLIAMPLQRLVNPDVSLRELLSVSLSALCAGMLIQGVLLPVMFRFGTEKARLFMLVLMGVVFAGIAALGQAQDALRRFMGDMNGGAAMAVLAGLAAAVYLVSMPLSIRAYRRRNS
ncbi:MAG: ABC-2 transporter permease [Candidatus Fimadaptatus sp.]